MYSKTNSIVEVYLSFRDLVHVSWKVELTSISERCHVKKCPLIRKVWRSVFLKKNICNNMKNQSSDKSKSTHQSHSFESVEIQLRWTFWQSLIVICKMCCAIQHSFYYYQTMYKERQLRLFAVQKWCSL